MSAARTERLLNLLTFLLNTRRPVSLRDIRQHDEFRAYRTRDPKSGERAFERDKAALLELGVPLRWVPPEQDDDEEGGGGYIVDQSRYFLPDLKLEPGELALLSIAGAAAAAVEGFPGRATVVRALAKIGFDVDDAWSTPSLAHAPIRSGNAGGRVASHLQLLHDAVAQRRRLKMSYQSIRGDLTDREVDPYGLYYRQGVWYLVAYCHLRQAQRTFHLGRVRGLRAAHADRLEPEFAVPSDFDLSMHVQQRPWEFPHAEPIAVTIRLAERLVPAIPEIFGRRAEVQQTRKGTLVRLRVTHRAALVAAVLPYGAAAEVLEPADLRRDIGAIYDNLARRYAKRIRRRSRAQARASQ